MNIISLSANPFDVGFCSRQGLSIAFSRYCGVHYFWSEPGIKFDGWEDLLVWPRPRRVHPKLVLYSPPKFLPRIHWRPRVERCLRAARLVALRSALDNGWPGPRVLYIWDPHFVDYVDGFDADLVCYHIYDNHRAFCTDDAGRATVIEKETRLLERTDVIVTCSRSLADFHGVLDRATYCPAAVDSSFIDRAAKARARRPADLPTDGPIIGYTGAIGTKVDLDVLEAVATRNPSWRVVLIGWLDLRGELLDKFESIIARRNVSYLGVKPWSRLPDYISAFDVGMLCYRSTEWSRFCEIPLKLFEYLAAGKPVVGGGLSHLSSLGGLVRLSGNPAEFAENVERALAEDSPRERQRRIAAARQNTWDSRARDVLSAIYGKLKD